MMSIYKIDDRYDLCLSMTWEPGHPHRISGHVFEIVDYYLVISKQMNVCIFFGDTFHAWEQFEKVIISKYQLTSDQLDDIKDNTYFFRYPVFLYGSNILFVDGGLRRLENQGTKLMFNRIFAFKCSFKDTIYNVKYNVVLLQDDRVYMEHNPQDVDISINYKKKIKFDKLIPFKKPDISVGLIYATKNCRYLSQADILKVTDQYNFDEYLVLTEDLPDHDLPKNICYKQPPVVKLFDMFSTFIYTPLAGVFDGSPRFPAECKFFGHDVIYHDIDDQYLQHDTGLFFRMKDIEHSFESIHLQDDDEILDIIKSNI